MKLSKLVFLLNSSRKYENELAISYLELVNTNFPEFDFSMLNWKNKYEKNINNTPIKTTSATSNDGC